MKRMFWALSACTAAVLLFLGRTPAAASGGAAAGGMPSDKSSSDISSIEEVKTGGGGQGMSMAIMPLNGKGIAPDLLGQLHGELVSNMAAYSRMDVMNRVSLEQTLKENESYIYADDSGRTLRAGEVLHTDYILSGTVTQTGDGCALQFQIEDTKSGLTKAAHSGQYSNGELQDYRGIRRASMDLLQKMGVQLTAREKAELEGAAGEDRIRAQNALARMAQATTFNEAITYLYEAQGYDSSLSAEVAAMINVRNKAETSMLAAPAQLPMPQLPVPQFTPVPQLTPPDLIKPELIPEKQPLPPPVKTGNIREDAKARLEEYKINQENERIRQENERIRRENEKQQEQIRQENERIMEAYRQETARIEEEHRQEQARIEEEHRQEQARIEEEYRQEQARIDAENGQRWKQFLQENEAEIYRYLIENPVFELVYTPEVREGELNFEAETMALLFDAALIPRKEKNAEMVYRTVEQTVQNLREQLAATGRAKAWGLDSWPEKSADGGRSPFAGRRRGMRVEAVLLDDKGDSIGRQGFTLTWGWAAAFTKKGMTLSADSDPFNAAAVQFSNVPVKAITDTLTIEIVKINDMDAAAGTVSYGIAEGAKREALEGAVRRAAAAVRAEDRARARADRAEERAVARAARAAAAREKARDDWNNSALRRLLPHVFGIGGNIFTGDVTVLVYNPFYRDGEIFHFFFDGGCDFSFSIHGNNLSFYPNAQIGIAIGAEPEYGFYYATGFGVMRTSQNGAGLVTPTWDWKAGLKYGLFDIAFKQSLALTATEDSAFVVKDNFPGFRMTTLYVGIRIPY